MALRSIVMLDVLPNNPTVMLHAYLRAHFILSLVNCLAFGWSVGAVVVGNCVGNGVRIIEGNNGGILLCSFEGIVLGID